MFSGCDAYHNDAVQVSLRLQANPDNALYLKDKSLEVDVVANDLGIAPGVNFVVVAPPQKGVVSLGADGVATYEPAPDSCGEDSFVYGLDDGIGGYSEALVSLKGFGCVLYEAVDDDVTYTQGGDVVVDVKGNDLGSTHLANVYLLSSPSQGMASIDSSSGIISYFPNPNFCGEDVLTYALVGEGGYSEAKVVLRTAIDSCAQSVIAVADSFDFTGGEIIEVDVFANDRGITGSETVMLLEMPSHGMVSLLGGGVVRYLPQDGFCGTDEFIYAISSAAAFTSARVILQAKGCIPHLVAYDDVASYSYNQPVTFDVSTNDVGITESSTVSLLTAPVGGQVTIYSDGKALYVPQSGYCDTDNFIYKISNGSESVQAKVTLIPKNCRELPMARPDIGYVGIGESVSINLLANDEGYIGTDRLYLLTTPKHGVVRMSAYGQIEYSSSADFCGIDSFYYVLDDGYGHYAEAQVSIATLNCGHAFDLTWQPSLTPHVRGYRVYSGRESGVYGSSIDVGDIRGYRYIVEGPGNYYFAITAISEFGDESEFSTEKVLTY